MNNKQIILKLFLALVVFAVSVTAYYYPIQKRGHIALGDFLNLASARNFAVSGTYDYESNDGALLSTERVKAEAKASSMSNPLTPIIYGQIIKYFDGEADLNLLPTYTSIILAGVFNLLVFLLMAQLFGAKIGFVSAVIMTVMPFRVTGALYYGLYEFAMVFFVLALWFYLGSKNGLFKAGTFRLVVSSAFFALAALARNAFLISFAPFILYDFYKNRSYKRSLIFIIPFVIIFSSTLTPYSWLGTPNGYTSGIDAQPFQQLSHVFADPYSAYYDRDNVIKSLEGKDLSRLQTHFLKQWGYDVSWRDQLVAYKVSATYYILKTFDLTNFGGPLVILIMLAGGYWLYKNKKDLLWLFSVWLVIWFLGLVYFETGNWDHFLELSLIAASLTGLGVYQFWQWSSENVGAKGWLRLGLGMTIFILVAGHLAHTDKWKLFDAYRSSNMGVVLEFSDKLEQIKNKGVIAAGVHPDFASGLYYLTDRDIVYFSSNTVKELIGNGKLKNAFEVYHVRTAVGFSEDLSADIKKITNAEVIPWGGKSE